MFKTIQARLDDETAAVREELQSQLGWSDSQIVRHGIRALASLVRKPKKRKFYGMGEYDFGISDLSTNPKYMEGFGES
jgi:hypothetical protein